MTAEDLIDSYVADVVTLLPRRQRRDVAQELRVLLREEADAAASGQASREQAARSLLAGFGRPAEVAARYGSPLTLIDPA
ncbi:MAG TPA: permease prefix domain 1-containing protein, partial [Ktedonobacterales bacterium]|nr:permease prefix domain 1-containing protein [Ktedonobacterales bacterium]